MYILTQGPQTPLLRHVLRQPYCKETVISMLDLQHKQRYVLLEENLVELYLESLEKCVADEASQSGTEFSDGFEF